MWPIVLTGNGRMRNRLAAVWQRLTGHRLRESNAARTQRERNEARMEAAMKEVDALSTAPRGRRRT